MSKINETKRESIRGVVIVAIALLILFVFRAGVMGIDHKGTAEGRKQLEQALERCAVACYATEGIYPPDVEYMKEHYGIIVDEDCYKVIYRVYAENLMPEITVLEKHNEE